MEVPVQANIRCPMLAAIYVTIPTITSRKTNKKLMACESQEELSKALDYSKMTHAQTLFYSTIRTDKRVVTVEDFHKHLKVYIQ